MSVCAGPAHTERHQASTGRRTPEGMERLRQAPPMHGRRGAEACQAARDRGAARREMAALNALPRKIDGLEQHVVCQ